MTSVEIEELDGLLTKTEANLKLIQEVGGDFVYPMLNEWRYATRHIVNLLVKPNEADFQKTIGHLKRAYFDSCDILLNCLLQNIADHYDAFRGYASIVNQIVPDFQQHNLRMHEAIRVRERIASAKGDARESEYDALAPYIVSLMEFARLLSSTRVNWIEDIRKQKLRDRLPVLISIVGIAISVAIAILGMCI